MNKLITVVLLSALASSLATGCADAQAKRYTDPSQAIEICVGERFVITVDANPSTGYRWETDFDSKFVKLVESEFAPGVAAQPGTVGAGGKQSFTFQGLRKGTTELTLTYKRPWEEGFADQKTFTVYIK